MCIICVDLAKQKLTPKEARRHLGEMREAIGEDHAKQLEADLAQAEKDARDAKP